MAKRNDADKISAQELAKRARETYHTVDHWAGEDLLTFERRGKTRFFPAKENVDRCRRIRELQKAGHNLVTIKGMLS